MDLYKAWVDENEKKGIYELINKDMKGSTELLDHFHHLIYEHNSDDASFEYIYNVLSDSNCSATKCNLMSRNNRDRNDVNSTQIRKDLFHGFSDSKNVAIMQTLDKIHCHYCHSYEIGMRFTIKEKEKISEEAMSSDNDYNLAAYQSAVYGNEQLLLRTESKESDLESISLNDPLLTSTLKIINDKKQKLIKLRGMDRFENNKFNTIIETEENQSEDGPVTDELYGHLLRQQIKHENISMFDRFIKDEEYDTDALEQDTESAESSNLFIAINNVKTNEEIASYLHPVIKNIEYSFGIKYYYDAEHKDIDGIIPVVNGGGGHRICDWWIAPKYASLKEELLANPASDMGKDQYDDLVLKADELYESNHCKRYYRRHRWYWDWPTRGHQSANNFSAQHIMSGMVYCNFTKLQYEYSKTYRRLHANESDESVKNRHSHWAHLAKLLTDACYIYGTNANPGKTDTFWHGINCKLLFDRCVAVFIGPTSTSCSKEVTMNFAQENGILLKLHCGFSNHPSCYATFLDCCWMTDFVYEDERLFIGQSMSLVFKTIITTVDCNNYERWIYFLSVLNVFFGDMNLNVPESRPDWFEYRCKRKSVNVKKGVLKLLSHELHRYFPQKYKKINSLPEYMTDLLHQYFISKTDMQIEWFNDQYQTFPACKNMKEFFRSSLVCVQSNNQWMDLPLFCVLFPELKQIKVKLNWENNEEVFPSKVSEHFIECIGSQLPNINEAGSSLRAIVFWFHGSEDEEIAKLKSKYTSKYEGFGWTLNDVPFEMVEKSFVIQKV